MYFHHCNDNTNVKTQNNNICYDAMKMQAGNITTNPKFKVNLCLPKFGETKIETWNYHVDYYSEIKYIKLLGINLQTRIILIKKSEHIIEGGYGPCERCTSPMVDLGVYEFKIFNMDKIKPK